MPHANGAECIDGADAPASARLYEENCETDTDDCADDPCLNNATCEDLSTPSAVRGSASWVCETNIDDCIAPCENGASCGHYG